MALLEQAEEAAAFAKRNKELIRVSIALACGVFGLGCYLGSVIGNKAILEVQDKYDRELREGDEKSKALKAKD